MKACTRCGIVKPLTEFSKNRSTKSGFASICKSCRAKYYQANKETIAEKQRQYHQDNKKRINEYSRQWRQDNKEATREYLQGNKEMIKKQKKQWVKTTNAAQPACVYEILNMVNNRAYIGQTIRGELRWMDHMCALKGDYHRNRNLQADYDRYGLEAFEWRMLQEFEIKDEKILLREEAKTIQQYVREGRKLYNLILTIEQLEMLEQ